MKNLESSFKSWEISLEFSLSAYRKLFNALSMNGEWVVINKEFRTFELRLFTRISIVLFVKMERGSALALQQY